MWIFWHRCSLCMKTFVRVGAVVGDLKLTVLVKETVPTFQIAFSVAFLITELTVVSEEKGEGFLDWFKFGQKWSKLV